MMGQLVELPGQVVQVISDLFELVEYVSVRIPKCVSSSRVVGMQLTYDGQMLWATRYHDVELIASLLLTEFLLQLQMLFGCVGDMNLPTIRVNEVSEFLSSVINMRMTVLVLLNWWTLDSGWSLGTRRHSRRRGYRGQLLVLILKGVSIPEVHA
jgi:hypothetical protein